MEIGKIVPLNFALIGNPVNWLIIILMVWIAGLALALLFHRNVMPLPANT
jgi:hypothetical protein